MLDISTIDLNQAKPLQCGLALAILETIFTRPAMPAQCPDEAAGTSFSSNASSGTSHNQFFALVENLPDRSRHGRSMVVVVESSPRASGLGDRTDALTRRSLDDLFFNPKKLPG